jgi:molybdate transport system regulatory protein
LERLSPKANFWAELDGQVVLSDWRVRLLEAVAETGSITAAAHELGIQYRLAWDRIHEMEQHLGQQLVDTQIGGPGGGGAQLTPTARDYIQRWHDFHTGLDALVVERFAAAFQGSP